MQPESVAVTMIPGVPGPVRAMHSLRPAHVATLSRSFAPLSPAWSLEPHESCDGDLILVLLSTTDDDCFVVSRSPAGFHLARLLDDAYTDMGVFASIDALALAACTHIPAASGGPLTG